MLLLTLAAFASDSGIQRVYDREIHCPFHVDPPADAAECTVLVRRSPPDDERPTWAFGIAPPGKLFLSMHMAAIDWGHVYRVSVPRAFDPVLVSTGLAVDEEACPGELTQYLHIVSERGPLTKQVCAKVPWKGSGEVLLESHRKLPENAWVPIWAWVPEDEAQKSDVKNWFIVQAFLSTDGATPDRPEQHPYVSAAVVRAWVPGPLPIRRRLKVMGPLPEAVEAPDE